MRDEASLARLAEMGVEVYLARGSARAPVAVPGTVTGAASTPPPAPATPVAASVPAPVFDLRILLLADAAGAHARLLSDVVRTLRFARIDGVVAVDGDLGALDGAAGLVLFGETLARSIGAAVPAQRQRELAWIVSGEPAALARDARAKRALWSELRRVVRTCARAVRG